jgi:hypothetical protein
VIELRIPGLVPKTNMNSRAHWGTKKRIAKHERIMVRDALKLKFAQPRLPLVVTLIRCSTGWPDSDQAVTSMKHVRDGVADFIGVDDGDNRITWNVERRRVPRREQGTVIRIEAAGSRAEKS